MGTFSASPNPANQCTEIFTATFLNQNTAKTYTDLASSYVLITNAARSGANTCYVRYYQPTQSLYLVNDNGTGVMGPLTIGSSGMLSNSQCTVNAIGSSAQGLGSTLTLTLSLTASPTFTGTKDIYALAIDGADSNSGWQNEGTWRP